MARFDRQDTGSETELSIPLEKVCFIIMKAREFDAKDVETQPDPGSSPSDDHEIGVLEDRPDDPSLEELGSLISSLSVDEQIDLVALVWLGRSEYPDEWKAVRTEASNAHSEHTAGYLCGNPLLADHLSDGLSILGLSCADYEMGRL